MSYSDGLFGPIARELPLRVRLRNLLPTRVWVAFHALRGHPTIYRVRFEDGGLVVGSHMYIAEATFVGPKSVLRTEDGEAPKVYALDEGREVAIPRGVWSRLES